MKLHSEFLIFASIRVAVLTPDPILYISISRSYNPTEEYDRTLSIGFNFNWKQNL